MARTKSSAVSGERSATGSELSPPWAFGLFAVVFLAVGVAMFLVRHRARSETEAARHWFETPCTIDKCEFVAHDDGSSLELVYRYEFGGATYRGDRLDLLIGSMGDDAAWEKQIFERHPPGSKAVCYVDPADPANSVFDRDHAATKSRNLWLLAFPFLCIGSGFSLALLTTLVGGLSRPKPDAATLAARGWAEPASPPPRKVSLLQRIVVLAGPLGSQMAWLFVVGFTFVFTIFDGPKQLASLIRPTERDGIAVGTVTDVRRLDQRELYESLYEYDVAFNVDGAEYTATGVTRGQKHDKGDQVDVTYPTGKPALGVIADARESSFTWWYAAIPGGVLALLAFGLVAMYWHNFRVVRLLARGEVAVAKWQERHVAGAIDADDPTKTGYEVPAAATNYRFEVHGFEYAANSYGPAPKRSRRAMRRAKRRAGERLASNRDPAGNEDAPPSATLDELHGDAPDIATVLYHPRRPRRNVLLAGYLADVVRGRLSLGDMLLNCAAAPLAAAAIWLLFAVE